MFVPGALRLKEATVPVDGGDLRIQDLGIPGKRDTVFEPSTGR